MSKKAEILHKLSTDDRVYLSEKFKEKDTKIAELQDKLAKKDEEITRRLVLQEKDYEEEINQLKQQLAEKEKEIERIKTTYIGGMQNANEATRIFKEEYYKADQEKISFAIKQLEKARTQFRTKYTWYEETHRVCEKTDNFVIWLDSQIKELKEGK